MVHFFPTITPRLGCPGICYEMNLVWMALLLLAAGTSDCARILVMQPHNARSHSIAVEPLFEELASRGHHLTLVTSFPHKPPLPNLYEIDVSYRLRPMISNFSFEAINRLMPNSFQSPLFMSDLELYLCNNSYSEPQVQKLLDSDEKFDLVITEIFSSDCFAPLAHRFNAPLVSVVTSCSLPWVADRVGLPDNPSYIPNYLAGLPTNMDLYQRVYNTVLLVWAKLVHRYYAIPQSQNMANEVYGSSTPPINDLIKNTSLVLVNSHISLSLSRPFPPNVVEIGGIHIRNTSNSLPKDLQDILDKSTQGAVVVSFGSLVRMSTLPEQIINKFMKAFSSVPQTVIFKYEDDLHGVPSNVVIRQWLPQQEILAHKNVRAVFGHGGLSSTIEAVYFGKPLIGLPFFADQYLNVKGMVSLGAAVQLNMDDLSEENIRAAIKEVIYNPKYTENIRRLSRQFRDRPMSAMETAVYWIEYVIRHHGALHLRPSSVSLALYQYLLLDVIAVLFLPVFLLLYFIYFLFFRAVEVSPNDHKNYKLKKNN
ncbi:UDP-glucosyltransferase 2-like [Homalodisca vitripennis]|uniref:UDP-glucosyltransferase 2-like n=1 Tax=Homalodisca vitripennis TaxID=197043 RepID=UPI001EEA3750|nr:UDP-glucosyltransferase 2-like [Homalodisca vitripennis]